MTPLFWIKKMEGVPFYGPWELVISEAGRVRHRELVLHVSSYIHTYLPM